MRGSGIVHAASAIINVFSYTYVLQAMSKVKMSFKKEYLISSNLMFLSFNLSTLQCFLMY